MSKLCTLGEAVERHVVSGGSLCIAGFTHLIDFAAAHEIIRRRIEGLTLIRLTPDLVYDQMVAAGCAERLVFSYIGNPGVGAAARGQAPHRAGQAGLQRVHPRIADRGASGGRIRCAVRGCAAAGRYSLLDRSGESFLSTCADRGIGVMLGGVFNSGVLADPDGRASYDYAPAAGDVLARAHELRRRCAAHDVSLPAVALQFARRHTAVTTVVIGARSAAEIELDVAYASVSVPDSLWSELE